MPGPGLTLYPIERLGNQLFMWAAALSQARRLGCDLHVNLAYYHRRPKRADRPYGLDAFDNGMIVDPEEPLLKLPAPGLAVSRVYYRELLPRLTRGRTRVFVERSFSYDPTIEEIAEGAVLLGYFQSWRYFTRVADEVRRRVTTLRAPSSWGVEMADEIGSTPGATILNVRRGDYRDPALAEYHGIATRDYYARGLDLVRRLGVEGPVYVASDELDAVMEELAGLADLRPIAPPKGTDVLEVIIAMSRADAIVMGNSAFSWWAAWLGDRPGRPVIGPRPWFASPKIDSRDLLLPHWITLDARQFAEGPATDTARADAARALTRMGGGGS